MHLRTIAALTVVAALGVAACGSSSNDGSSSATTAGSEAATTTTSGGATTSSGGGAGVAGPATVALAQTSLGNILVDSDGMTLYIWDNDTTAGTSSCTGACASAWPPEAVTGTPTYGTGLNASMFSTITRDDGSKQLAVNGHPLYRWASDQKAGDTTGQGVNGFHVVGATGDKIG
jgi:predicted lipoprotein with Yx(FWY)xxD motif